MKISEIMSTQVVTVLMDQTLGEIRGLFDQNSCHHIPVVSDHQRLLGIVSDRDVLRSLSPDADSSMANNHAISTLKRKAHQIMTREVVTIQPDSGIEEAAAIMLDKKFSCLPVIDAQDAEGTLCGIVTKTDLLRSLCATNAAE